MRADGQSRLYTYKNPSVGRKLTGSFLKMQPWRLEVCASERRVSSLRQQLKRSPLRDVPDATQLNLGLPATRKQPGAGRCLQIHFGRQIDVTQVRPGAQLVHEQGVAAAVHASETAFLLYRATTYAGA